MIGVIPNPYDVPLDQPWNTAFRFWVGRGRSTPAVLTAGSAILRPRGCGSTPVQLTVLNGRIVLAENVLAILVDPTVLASIGEGTCDLEVRATINASSQRQLRAVVNLRSGL